MRAFFQKNAIPIFIEAAFLIACFLVPRDDLVFLNLLFYLLLFLYFCLNRSFSFREWAGNLKNGKGFWGKVALTMVFFLAAFGLTIALENLFPDLDTGMIALKRDTPLRLAAFAVSTILLPAVTEETFYRKNIISFQSKPALVATTLCGMLLYAAEHALKPWGILLTMLWALPLTLSYLKTKNIYVPMTAHLIGNLLGNGADVIFSVIALCK